MTLQELIEEWLYNHKNDIKPRTLLRYECAYRVNILPYYGDIDITTITRRDVQRWVNEMRTRISGHTNKTLSATSINLSLLILKLAFSYAEDYEIISSNPTTKVKNIPIERTRSLKVLTKEEQIKLEKYIDKLNDDEYFVYILSLYTGLRLGEVMALSYKDINFKTGVMYISKSRYKTKIDNRWVYIESIPKTKNSIREIPLPGFIKDKLKEMKKEHKSKYVVSRNDGGELTDKVVVWRLSHILKILRIRLLCFHSLRHTFATRALENKMDIKTLSEILGHSSVVTTLNIYTHSLIKHKKQQMRKIKRII